MSTTTRIATVTSSGKQYIVQQRHSDKVYCWGEVTRYTWRGDVAGSATHSASKVFLESAVTVTEVPRTTELYKSLWNQFITSTREAGHQVAVSKSGKTATIYPKQTAKDATVSRLESELMALIGRK